MTNFYDWKTEDIKPFIAIISVTIGFLSYWFLVVSEKIKAAFFRKYEFNKASIYYVFFQKMMGFLFMGVFPGIVMLNATHYTLADLGFKTGNYKESLVYIVVIGLLFITITYFTSRNPFNIKTYPQMRIKEWTAKLIFINSFGWAATLLASEFMYRGILLIVCYNAFGFWPAVAINICFHATSHIGKGITESFGAFPYVPFLCYATISTGSLAVAFFTHVILALSNDYFAIHHNPEMKYV
ncbi:MAG: CPBP family intramembrane glutamic endopeptidase [Bacteroidia bacterium]